jgi:hypothetical protein
MKTTAPPRGTFSKADREKIKQILASIGVDLDTASVSAHSHGVAGKRRVYRYSTDKHPWLSTGPEWRLDQALQRLAYFYTLSEPKTPKQWAKKLKRALALTEKAIKQLDFVRLAPVNNPVTAKHRAQYDRMMRAAAGLRECVTELQVIDSKGQSALTAQTKYFRELKNLWRALAGPRKRLNRKLLGQFLLACSRPLFPNKRLAQKVSNFLTRP